jgi:predicted Fe-S protein YdhL (DUF1289 family)
MPVITSAESTAAGKVGWEVREPLEGYGAFAACWPVALTRGVVGGAGMEDDPPSPCTRVCRIDPADGLCVGCARRIEEIIAWPEMDAEAKRAVWERIGVRRRR